MANPTLTPFPTPPLPEQDEVTFNRNAANSLLAQANFVGEANAVVTWMGNQVTDVTTFKDQAAASAKAAAKSVEDAAAQVKLATDQAVASKGSADAAKGYRDSAQVSAQAAQASAGLPPTKVPGAVLRQMLDGSGGVEWWSIVVTQVGDTIVSTQAPDAGWVPTGRIYNKALYPQLFAKLGSIADWLPSTATVPGQMPPGYNFSAFAVGGGISVALSTTNALVSNDYFTTNNVYTNQLQNYQWADVEYGFGKFFTCASNASGVWASPTGTGWSQVTGAVSGGNNFRLRFGNNVMLLIQGGSTGGSLSTDGNSFTAKTFPFTPANIRPAFGKGLFVALSTSLVIWTSPDGNTWTNRGAVPFASTNNTYYVVAADNGFMIFESLSGNCAFSADGVTWVRATTCPIPGGNGNVISGGAGGFIVQTNSSPIYVTTLDGTKWLQRTLGPIAPFTTAAYVAATKTHIFISNVSGSNVIRIKPYSYDPDAQFLTTEPITTPQGLNQYIRAA